MSKFSDYIIYVDESGDHSLDKVDSKFPIFVLVFCIFQKQEYINKITPLIQKLKFDYFGYDLIILHEREIRKNEGVFKILVDSTIRNNFLAQINEIMRESDFKIITSVIKKEALKQQYIKPENPYKLSLLFCLERVNQFLEDNNQQDKITHIVFESRGKKEDEQLELEFRRICQSKGFSNFEIIFKDKQVNSTGLQLADLIARPIGYHVLKPAQINRAYEIIQKKFATSQSSNKKQKNIFGGFGLKEFP